MAENSFGANIIEILTAGMYQDSKVIYREYIQNSCDQIDKAEQLGILKPRNTSSKYPDLGEGKVDIWLEPEKRYIAIEDNATGIKADEFQRTLLNIADSDKIVGQDKGFRGIGRLCGLAYCRKLIFTSRWNGESDVSILECDALKMREMINEANTKVRKHSANDVINAMTSFRTRTVSKDDPEHFFKVELIDVNKENEELFGGRDENSIEQLSDYLSFVAPVPYQANFMYRTEIYEHAKQLGVNIDEYDIRVDGAPIFKKYKTHLKTGNGQDDVYGVECHDFEDNNGNLLGWMWFGKTSFKAAIKDEEISRGLRLRKENIQIGEKDALRDMFTREASRRGNNYFIGEIFAISHELIPNSQRSYFNENPTRIVFEHALKDYFNNTLYQIYYEGSDINSSIKKLSSFNDRATEFQKKKDEGKFLSSDELTREESELSKIAEQAMLAQKKLARKSENGRSIISAEIVERRSSEIKQVTNNVFLDSYKKEPTTSEAKPSVPHNEIVSPKSKKKFLVDTMFPQASKSERKLLAETLNKVFTIIQRATDKKTSENLIKRIKEELE